MIGVPSIIIWVISTPVVAFVILFKNRNNLEDNSIKQYYLILYQGFTRKAFYWEFVNAFRKVIIIALNTIFSVLSLNYRLMMCIVLLVFVERMQQRLKPYKVQENNDIEIKAIIAGTTVLFTGIIFEEGAKHNYPRFDTFAISVILIYNAIFLIKWTYLFLVSCNFRSTSMKRFLEIYGYIICIKKAKRQMIHEPKTKQ